MTDVKSYLILLCFYFNGGRDIFYIFQPTKKNDCIFIVRVGHIFDKSMTIEGQLLIDNDTFIMKDSKYFDSIIVAERSFLILKDSSHHLLDSIFQRNCIDQTINSCKLYDGW